ncbi:MULTISPECIES: helix-turn-helix domain-containing protein [Oxalobacteraceae]|jgi:DNA-binding HxlR family transcriptional regulator|uniref:winged helix-turn-helix transcriptional regulator n=1 Tax=Oxalobacteraceae TaxID=75682 RepID=UPI002B7A362E|nr:MULTISPECIES: helix-turn-helix domain-containing protein [Oxalobacteraceae]HTD04056.1 helix-turn-helix domain-containing protein [Undibacterium sp.]HWW07580.1 helix-turn-helix domain-containing protein [Collimonas sp.]
MNDRNTQVTAIQPAAVLTRSRGRPSAREDLPCPIRDVLDRIGDAWSVLVITTLEPGPGRFNQLRRQVDGISQRMLTVTLRHLERDGLVSRTVIPSTPPQVEYALTETGRSLCLPLKVLADWAGSHQTVIRGARRQYDVAGK